MLVCWHVGMLVCWYVGMLVCTIFHSQQTIKPSNHHNHRPNQSNMQANNGQLGFGVIREYALDRHGLPFERVVFLFQVPALVGQANFADLADLANLAPNAGHDGKVARWQGGMVCYQLKQQHQKQKPTNHQPSPSHTTTNQGLTGITCLVSSHLVPTVDRPYKHNLGTSEFR